MSDIMVAQAEQLRTLALNEEQAIETARRQLDAAVHRRDAFLAAANVLDPIQPLTCGDWTVMQVRTREEVLSNMDALLAVSFAPVDEDHAVDVIENRCPECSQFESECECPDALPAVVAKTYKVKAKAGRPKGSPAVGGKPQKYDRAEIARVARQAQADRTPMNPAVAAHFGCTEMTASKLIQAARKAGEDIPHLLPPRGKQTAPKLDESVDNAPAPTVVPAQVTAPKQPDTGADTLVPLFPPGKPRPPYSPKVGESVLVCDDCGQPFERNVTRLSLHTHDKHDRAPFQAERLPRTWQAEDDETWSLELVGRHA